VIPKREKDELGAEISVDCDRKVCQADKVNVAIGYIRKLQRKLGNR
jgi:hypothetical protein